MKWWWAGLLILAGGVARADTTLVLPFFNHTGSANLDWIGESIAETVGDALTSEGLLLLDREDRVEGYRRLSVRMGAELTHATILKIGDSLDATYVVYGTYELLADGSGGGASKGSLRITARVVDLKRMRQGASFSEIDSVEALATLEFRLSWQVLKQLKGDRAPAENAFLQSRPAVRLDAMESFARGLGATSDEQRHAFLMRAARLDDKYSAPAFQLGKEYWEKKEYKSAADWLARVKRPDPHYLESQFYLGLCKYNMSDFSGAEQALGAVADEMPLSEAINDLGAAQARRKDFEGAIASFKKAVEGDSGDPDFHFNLGYELWRAGRFDEAVESFRAVVERSPSDAEATTLLGRALKKDGPRVGDPRTEARERLKLDYEERAYRQLQAELGK